MPNFNKQFQDEIRRLARKETKDDLERLKREQIELRKSISSARKLIDKLQRDLKRVGRNAPAEDKPAGETEGEAGGVRARVSGKTIRLMRAKMGLTQAEFAKLVGVTGQSIYQWERKEGQLTFRGGAKERIVAVKGLGAREARKRLADMNVVRKRGPRKPKAE